LTLRLETDPATGRRDLYLDLTGDEDLLPHEHEQLHRRLLEQVFQTDLAEELRAERVILTRQGESQELQLNSQGVWVLPAIGRETASNEPLSNRESAGP